jgi:thymidylate kinase
MSFVILEGNDGTGKSTLANMIMVKYAAVVVPVGPPRTNRVFSEYVSDVMAWGKVDRVIFDRFHLGTHAYGIAYREGADLNPLEWGLLENMLMERRALLVLCDPGEEENAANLARRREEGVDTMYETVDKEEEVRLLMREAYDRSGLPRTIYDYRSHADFDLVANMIETFLCWSRGEQHAAVHMRST